MCLEATRVATDTNAAHSVRVPAGIVYTKRRKAVEIPWRTCHHVFFKPTVSSLSPRRRVTQPQHAVTRRLLALSLTA